MAIQLGELADVVAAKAAEIDKINATAKAKTAPLEKELKDLEQQLQLAMQDAGVEYIEGKKSTAELKDKLRIGFADWDEFIKFAKRKDAFHLFERRIGAVAYRELKANMGGKAIPGLSEFQQTSLNVSKKKA